MILLLVHFVLIKSHCDISHPSPFNCLGKLFVLFRQPEIGMDENVEIVIFALVIYFASKDILIMFLVNQ